MSILTDLLLAAFSILAILLQAAAIQVLLAPGEGLDPLQAFVVLQALASLSITLVAGRVISRRYDHTTSWLYFYLFISCLFMPVAGMLTFFTLWLVIALFDYNHLWLAAAREVPQPEFVPKLVRDMTYGGGTRVRARLENTAGSDTDRMAAMTALQSMPIHLTDQILRRLLGDHKEELRLLAYGLMDKAEKVVMNRIADAQHQLQQTDRPAERGNLHALLAQLYWELVYQHLVAGDVYHYVLDKVTEHASRRLDLDAGDATMWYLKGRCALLSGQPQQAADYLEQARVHRYPHERLLPWLAEVEFQNRNYSKVREQLARVDNKLAASLLQPNIKYWTT